MIVPLNMEANMSVPLNMEANMIVPLNVVETIRPVNHNS